MAKKQDREIRAAMQRLRLAVKLAGLRATAREMGLSPSYVSELLGGTRAMGRKAKAALGVEAS